MHIKQTEYQARTQRATQACREYGITQAEIASAVDASQSQVSRILHGKGQRNSRLSEEVCLYVERQSGGVTADMVRENEVLVKALASTWDGSATHAKALSTVILSLSALRHPNPTGQSRNKE